MQIGQLLAASALRARRGWVLIAALSGALLMTQVHASTLPAGVTFEGTFSGVRQYRVNCDDIATHSSLTVSNVQITPADADDRVTIVFAWCGTQALVSAVVEVTGPVVSTDGNFDSGNRVLGVGASVMVRQSTKNSEILINFGDPPSPPPPPTPVALADALNSIHYLYPDMPPAVNGVNVGQPGQNFRDTFFDCDAITETATYFVPPPTGVTTMRVDLINFLNCSVITTPNVNPSLSGNFQRRTLATNGQAAITNTATGKTLTVIFGNAPAATSALSSISARGVVGSALTPIGLPAINITATGYSIDPALPDGLSIDASSGVITGTPTLALSGQYAITAGDGSKQATGILTLEVSATQAYDVTFDQNLGTNPLARAVSPGQLIVLPPTNSLASNSVFGGWYTEPNGAGDFAGMNGAAYTPTSSLTLYANWAPAVTVTFQRVSTADPHPVFPPELQPLVNASSNLVMPVAQGSLITLPVPTRPDAGFRGWYNATSCPTSGTQPSTFIGPGGAQVVAPSTSTATWRACWQTTNLNIDFNPNSGTFTGFDDSCTGTASCRRTWTAVGGPLAPSGRPQVTTPTPGRTDHIFNGWFTASSGGERVAGANEPLGVDTIEPSPSNSARIYRAQWTPLIRLDPGEGNEVSDERCERDPNTPRQCLIPWVDANVILPIPTSATGQIPTGWRSGSTFMGDPGEKILFAPWGAITLVSDWIAPPAEPINLTASPSDGQLHINFTPGDDGGSPITGYEYRISGSDNWISATDAPPITITGLDNGTEYTITLRAINAVGAGAESEAITATPGCPSADGGSFGSCVVEQPLSAPTNLTLTAAPSSAWLSFTPPAGEVTHYSYRWTSPSDSPWISVSASDAIPALRIRDLANGVEVCLSLRAHDALRTSEPTAVVCATPFELANKAPDADLKVESPRVPVEARRAESGAYELSFAFVLTSFGDTDELLEDAWLNPRGLSDGGVVIDIQPLDPTRGEIVRYQDRWLWKGVNLGPENPEAIGRMTIRFEGDQ
jgi:hypothetical protein